MRQAVALPSAVRMSRIFCTVDIIIPGVNIGISCRERCCFHQALGLPPGVAPWGCIASPAAVPRAVVQRHHDISPLRGRARRERRQMGVAKHRYPRRVEHTQPLEE